MAIPSLIITKDGIDYTISYGTPDGIICIKRDAVDPATGLYKKWSLRMLTIDDFEKKIKTDIDVTHYSLNAQNQEFPVIVQGVQRVLNHETQPEEYQVWVMAFVPIIAPIIANNMCEKIGLEKAYDTSNYIQTIMSLSGQILSSLGIE